MIGQTLGHYRIESKLGEGGMGVVWKAQDPRLSRFVALKVLPPGLAQNEERRARFIQEAQASSALNHPNIITIYDIGRHEGVDFIAMELVEGATLDKLITPRGLRTGDVLNFGAQIAAALAAAHESGIVHRDLKPSNIMVTRSGLVKVLDFGLAKLTTAEPLSPEDSTRTARELTEPGTVVGTAAYMSPEQAEGKPVDRRSDIFSFGTILYEMVSGARPFGGDTRLAILSAIVKSDPKPFGSPPPPELERIIRRCLRKDPAQRFQHMDDLQIILSDLKLESDSGALSPAGAVTTVGSAWPGRSRLALAALLITAGALAAFRLLSRSSDAPPTVPIAPVRQFTFDSGLTTDPAYWPAGRMIAYASDRTTGSNLDIWVQQIGGETRRLTSDEADDHEPDFSPDGTRIAFRSERDGGGIFVVSTLGGPERRLTSAGRTPRFSPDGRWISYWIGDPSRQFGFGQTFVIPASGGEPRQIAPKLAGATHAVWSPDSKHLLFFGVEKTKPEFYVEALDSGDVVLTGLAEATQALTQGNYPTAWVGNQFIFSAATGDAVNLFSIEIDPVTFRARGLRRRLTAGTGIESRPILAGNQLVFASALQNDDVWLVPIDPSTLRATGDALRITDELGSDVACSVSADGTRAAWFSVRSDDAHLMAKDLTTGQQSDLVTVRRTTPLGEDISADGQQIAYSSTTASTERTFVIPFSGGTPGEVCDGCMVRDWSGPAALLVSRPSDGFPGAIYFLDLGSRTQRQIGPMTAPARGFLDGHWWAAYIPIGGPRLNGRSFPNIYVMPILPDRSATVDDLIAITPADSGDYLVDVAPDGTALFFLSPRDGFHCIWAQRIDPVTKHSTGPPFAVHHQHSARRSPVYVGRGFRRLTAARNKVVFTMAERTGNIWIADLSGPAR